MRSFVSTLILLCLLAVGGRPVEREIYGDGKSTVEPAHAAVAKAVVRRAGFPDGQVRPQLFVPVDNTEPSVPRAAVIVSSQPTPSRPIAFIVRSGSSRGPPHS